MDERPARDRSYLWSPELTRMARAVWRLCTARWPASHPNHSKKERPCVYEELATVWIVVWRPCKARWPASHPNHCKKERPCVYEELETVWIADRMTHLMSWPAMSRH